MAASGAQEKIEELLALMEESYKASSSSSSSSGTPTVCTYSDPGERRWSVSGLKRCLRRHRVADGLVLKKLEAAAETTLVRRNSISAFRECCFITKEGHGRLYDLVKLLAPPPAKDALDSNPYADFKAKHPEISLPPELDFLLRGNVRQRRRCNLDYDLGLSDEEADHLIFVLRNELIPEWLMRPCSFLTFEENLDIRVQVVRLWMKASKLPIYVGSSITFEELSIMPNPPVQPADFPLEENLPSSFLCRLREETLVSYHWIGSNTLGWQLTHPTPQQMPDNCIPYNKSYAMVHYPIVVKHPGCPPYSYVTGDAKIDEMEYQEEMEADLTSFKYTETPRMYKLLARLLFDREVET